MNSIYLRRKNKLHLKSGTETLPERYLATLLKNIEPLGYTLSPELAERVLTLSLDQLSTFYTELQFDLCALVGAHKDYKPMYPNFPEQVMQTSESDLYWNALWHYFGDWIGTRLMPQFEKITRKLLPESEKLSLKVIELGSLQAFQQIFSGLICAKSSLSEQDKKDLAWFIGDQGPEIYAQLPAEIPLRENVAFVGGLLLQSDQTAGSAETFLVSQVKTATDVLRLAAALSEGDLSLAEVCRFKSFPKRHRRLLLHLLEGCVNREEDFLRYPERWKRLGERLHPFDYVKRFPLTAQSFSLLWNNLPLNTFRGQVEADLIAKDISSALALLQQRPGELARRLDHLLRLCDQGPQQAEVLKQFEAVAAKVSSPVLLQLKAHFQTRSNPPRLRCFFPRGNLAKIQAIENTHPAFPRALCLELEAICDTALITRFKSYPALGRVYLDPALKNYTVPFGMRSAAKALKTLSRGSRLPLPEGNTLRFFIWWQDGKERTDLDLSALALKADHSYQTTLAYYNLKDLGAYHSGDITSAPNGASEFIDIDMAAFLNAGVRYVLMVVNSFTEQAFCDLPECFAGFMLRTSPQSGEIYEPRTVANRYDLSANTRITIPLIIDLSTKEVIWTDMSLTRNPSYSNNVHNNLSSLSLLNQAMTSLHKPDLYSLFQLHIQARGESVDQCSEANTVLLASGDRPLDQAHEKADEQRLITALDQEIILSEFL